MNAQDNGQDLQGRNKERQKENVQGSSAGGFHSLRKFDLPTYDFFLFLALPPVLFPLYKCIYIYHMSMLCYTMHELCVCERIAGRRQGCAEAESPKCQGRLFRILCCFRAWCKSNAALLSIQGCALPSHSLHCIAMVGSWQQEAMYSMRLHG